MGTYHTFFVAEDRHLDKLFPGWRRAKPEQETVESMNPFSKKMQSARVWVPVEPVARLGKPNLYDDVWGPAIEPVLQPEGEWAGYQQMIEEAGAPGLRALPHFRSKNVDPLYEFDALTGLVLQREQAVPPARIGDRADDDVAQVSRLPRDAARKLAAIDDATLRAVVAQLLVATDLSEQGDTGDDSQTEFIAYVMRPLIALCIAAESLDADVCHYFALHY
jgi:hypothetical protein